MKSKALIAMAVAGAFSAAAFANDFTPSAANETTPGMSTVLSLDNFTGGFKGWGPMPNPSTAASVDENKALATIDEQREYRQHLAEVNLAREQVWVANAPLRADYENIGATRAQAGGFGQYYGR